MIWITNRKILSQNADDYRIGKFNPGLHLFSVPGQFANPAPTRDLASQYDFGGFRLRVAAFWSG
jgi:hypothetical protein